MMSPFVAHMPPLWYVLYDFWPAWRRCSRIPYERWFRDRSQGGERLESWNESDPLVVSLQAENPAEVSDAESASCPLLSRTMLVLPSVFLRAARRVLPMRFRAVLSTASSYVLPSESIHQEGQAM